MKIKGDAFEGLALFREDAEDNVLSFYSIWPYCLMVRTLALQARDSGSNPDRVIVVGVV